MIGRALLTGGADAGRILRTMQPRGAVAPHPSVTCAVIVATEPAGRGDGASSAARPSGPPSALRRVGGVSLLRRAVRVLGEAGVDRIVVVTGHGSDAVAEAAAADGLPVELVVDAAWEQGTSSSVLLALGRIDDAGCLVVMGDRVFEAADVRRLLADPGANVLAVGPGGDDVGLSTVRVADVLAAAGGSPPPSWLDLRQRMAATGVEPTTCEFLGLWAAVDSAAKVRPLERTLWRRYGPKPTDQIIARTVNRRISGPLTRLLLRTGLAPDVATLLAFATTLVAAGLVGLGAWWSMVAGGLGVMLGSALDGVDGELARVSGRASRRGAALDTLLDRYADLAVVLGLVVGAGASSADWGWGFAAGCGCLLISYVHAIGRDTHVRLLFRREVRLLIFALAAIAGQPLLGLVVVAVAANLDTARGVVLLLRALRD